MEQITYRPYGYYRIFAWLHLGLAVVLCFISYYFILPGLLLLIPVFFLFRAGKVIIIADNAGVRLLNEKSCADRFLPWEQLGFYQLTNNLRGHDVILLSAEPLSPSTVRKYAIKSMHSTNLWFDGVLVIPLFALGNDDTLRKFIYQRSVQK